MKPSRLSTFRFGRRPPILAQADRKGSILLLATAVLILILAFTVFSVDVGYIALSKGQMQNAVDAAALAAVQELNPHLDQGDVFQKAVQAAKEVAALHKAGDQSNVSLDGNLGEVEFGRRIYNSATGKYTYEWGPQAVPYNLVKVTAERSEVFGSGGKLQEDNQLPLFFGPILGAKGATLKTTAIATFQPRDIMLVLDYSSSMNDDSELSAIDKLGQAAVEANILEMWQDLGSPTYGNLTFTPGWVKIPGSSIPTSVEWKNTEIAVSTTGSIDGVKLYFSNGNSQSFTSTTSKSKTYAGSGSNVGVHITKVDVKRNSIWETYYFNSDDNYADIKRGLGLTSVTYPYPSGSWDGYIDYVLSDSDHAAAGYRYKFGMMTLVNYWNKYYPLNSQTPSLWKASQQPITALKDSVDVLADYLLSVSADDNVGLSVYTYPNSAGAKLELGLGSTLSQVKTISRQRQAGHYEHYTNIGAGMKIARQELQAHKRPKAMQMMILMTDGLPNRSSTSASPTQFAIDEANLAKAADIMIITVSLGAAADAGLMQQIADITGGKHFNVPGGQAVSQYESQLKQVFGVIASDRPLKLIQVEETQQ